MGTRRLRAARARQAAEAERRARAERRWGAGARDASWEAQLARLGYVASGIVYIGIGLVGGAVAVGLADRPRSPLGVIGLVARLPLGNVMLGVLAAGLLGYAALNIAGAVRDPYGYGRGVRGWAMRGSDAIAGAVYLSLAAAAVRLIASPGLRAGDTAAQWAARVLALPLGVLWLALGGLAAFGSGLFLLRKAWVEPFEAKLDRRVLGVVSRRWAVRAARTGTVARALLLAISGGTAVVAAVRRTPEQVADLADGLEVLGRGVTGPLLLGGASAAFVAYGVYQILKARYRLLRLG